MILVIVWKIICAAKTKVEETKCVFQYGLSCLPVTNKQTNKQKTPSLSDLKRCFSHSGYTWIAWRFCCISSSLRDADWRGCPHRALLFAITGRRKLGRPLTWSSYNNGTGDFCWHIISQRKCPTSRGWEVPSFYLSGPSRGRSLQTSWGLPHQLKDTTVL